MNKFNFLHVKNIVNMELDMYNCYCFKDEKKFSSKKKDEKKFFLGWFFFKSFSNQTLFLWYFPDEYMYKYSMVR